VRELQNAIRRVVVLHDGELVTAAMLALSPASTMHAPAHDTARLRASAIAPFWRQEQKIIEAALAACGGNTARAAAVLEISPSTIYRKRQGWTQGRGAA
jgi:two-component system repressor protein LuxO